MADKQLTFGSLFSGIGGFDLGLERAGMRCAWQVEIDPFCQRVLETHWPEVKRYGDIRECGAGTLAPVDVICGGFPCQDVSLSGERAGLAGSRTVLWFEYARIVRELKPRWVVVENVPGLLSSDDGEFFGRVLRDLAESGFDAEWDVLPAAAVGAPHKRDRLFLMAYPAGVGLDALQIFEGSNLEAFAEEQVERWWLGRPAVSNDGAIFKVPVDGIIPLDDGVPKRVARPVTQGYGNAVVPQVAEWIGRRIVEMDRES